ncbi:hypothetical protein SCHPADRAFT_994742 [Schizopora paradoxa]|uniref:STE3-domain-containing protein n=1 Tax=Schizopora paradoxa TaxID=27342 RepID=A0A0H2RZ98_9AGAM|nr:hypothetical protein SCHPADRAFT_994742 [Schizopora paradoxa]
MNPEDVTPSQLGDVTLLWDYVSVYITGLFTWELTMTFDFDWSFISGRRKLKWPLVPYFDDLYEWKMIIMTRRSHIFEFNSDRRINCQVLYSFLGIFSNFSIASASICLAIRAVAIWLRNKFILVTIAIPCLIQWAFILRDIAFRRAIWSDEAQRCIVVPIPLPDLLLLYLPAMIFDFVVMVISAVGLFRQGPLRSALQVVVFRHGLIYFIVTFALNSLPVAFIFAPVSLTTTLVSTSSATFATVVVSCRLVRDLVLFAEDEERRRELLPTMSDANQQLPLDGSVATSDPPILSTLFFHAGKAANSRAAGSVATTLDLGLTTEIIPEH